MFYLRLRSGHPRAPEVLSRSSKQSGFTLIELLASMALMAMALALFLVDYTDARQEQELTQAAMEVRSAILDIQTWGQVGREAGPNTDPIRFERGYGVQLSTDTAGNYNRKIIYYVGTGTQPADCNSGACDVNIFQPGVNGLRTFFLPGKVTVTGIKVSGATSETVYVHMRRGISFLNIHDKNANAFEDDAEITIGNSWGSLVVYVSKSGLIDIRSV